MSSVWVPPIYPVCTNLTPRWRKLDTVRRGSLRDDHDAERFECPEEERFARCKVADAELDVVEHEAGR